MNPPVKLLVFGGTAFLGRHVVDAALAAGHEVAVFNRGITPAPTIAGVERLVGGDARFTGCPTTRCSHKASGPGPNCRSGSRSDAVFGGLMLGADERAVAAGLVKRPIDDTIRATLAWATSPDARTPEAVASMTAEREAALLRERERSLSGCVIST